MRDKLLELAETVIQRTQLNVEPKDLMNSVIAIAASASQESQTCSSSPRKQADRHAD